MRLDGTVIKYAATGLAAGSGAAAEVHGRIVHTTVGVSSGEYLDATNVDWGDSSGPAPIGSGTRIEGDGVSALPWKGWTPPPVPARSEPAAETPRTSTTCRRVMFLGVRGSGELPTNSADSGYTSWQDGFGGRVQLIREGFTGQLRARSLNPAEDEKGIALRYAALEVPVWENVAGVLNIRLGINAAFANAKFLSSVWQGVDRIEQYLDGEYATCGTRQKYVLSGYSQGALAIHIYLTQRAPAGIRNQIAAVGLLADPAKNFSPAEHSYGDGFNRAGAVHPAVWATGPYRLALLPGGGPLPADIVGRTVTMCHAFDIVCAPTSGATHIPHGNYSSSELTSMGKWLADTAIAEGLPSR